MTNRTNQQVPSIRDGSAMLKVFCYDNGVCLSALSLQAARDAFADLLPWPRNAKEDDPLVREIPDSELDGRFHFFWDEETNDEWNWSFRQELEHRVASGETEPTTFWDDLHLFPDRPSYPVYEWFDMRHRYLPPLKQVVWTTDGVSVRPGVCHSPLYKPICENFYWLDEAGNPLAVTHWLFREDSPLIPNLP